MLVKNIICLNKNFVSFEKLLLTEITLLFEVISFTQIIYYLATMNTNKLFIWKWHNILIEVVSCK